MKKAYGWGKGHQSFSVEKASIPHVGGEELGIPFAAHNLHHLLQSLREKNQYLKKKTEKNHLRLQPTPPTMRTSADPQ